MKQKNDYSINSVLNAHKINPRNSHPELSEEVKELIKRGEYMNKYTGNDNHGHPKSDYLQNLVNMDDNKLAEECESMIWLSAYANNNPRSDYHFMCDACYDECHRRNKGEIYTIAHKKVSKSI